MGFVLMTCGISVESEDRFEFGKNWQRFLCALNQNRIEAAEASLRGMLDRNRLDGQTFLDVGTGSGLFSLAARRLGAKVLSFDYDQESVACAQRLKNLSNSSEQEWHIEQGSALVSPSESNCFKC